MRLIHGLTLLAAAASLGAVAATDMDDAHLAKAVHSLSDKADAVEGFIKRKVDRAESALEGLVDKVAAAKGKGGDPPLSCVERAVATATDALDATVVQEAIEFVLAGAYQGVVVSGGEVGLTGVRTLFPACDNTEGFAAFDSRTGSYYGYVGDLQLSFVLSPDGNSVRIQWANTATGDLGEFTVQLGGGGGGRRLLADALTPAQLAAKAKALPAGTKGALFPHKTAKEAFEELKAGHVAARAAEAGKAPAPVTFCKPTGFLQSCAVLDRILYQIRPASPQVVGVSAAHAAAARVVTATAITACRASDVAEVEAAWTECPLCANGPCNIPLFGKSPVGRWGGPCAGVDVLPYASGTFNFTATPVGAPSTRSNVTGSFSFDIVPVTGLLAGEVDATGDVAVQGTAGGGICRWAGHFFTALNGDISCVGCSASGEWACNEIDGATCAGAWGYVSF